MSFGRDHRLGLDGLARKAPRLLLVAFVGLAVFANPLASSRALALPANLPRGTHSATHPHSAAAGGQGAPRRAHDGSGDRANRHVSSAEPTHAHADVSLPPQPRRLFAIRVDHHGKQAEVDVTVRPLSREEAKAHARDLVGDPRSAQANSIASQISGRIADFGHGSSDRFVVYGAEATIDGQRRFVGFMVNPSESHGKIELLHARADFGLKGVGSLLMADELRRAYANKFLPYLVLHAVSGAEGFYKRLGFRAVGPRDERQGTQMMQLPRQDMPAALARIYTRHGTP